jgi:hypothetical protein
MQYKKDSGKGMGLNDEFNSENCENIAFSVFQKTVLTKTQRAFRGSTATRSSYEYFNSSSLNH